MNAQELADYFEYELKDVFPYCILTIRMLREQADRIAELEKALDWIATVNAMDYEYQDVAKSLLKERHGIK